MLIGFYKLQESNIIMVQIPRNPFKESPTSHLFSSTKVEVLIPSTNKAQHYIGSAAHRKRVAQTVTFMTKEFGGTTRISADGTYVMNNKVVSEPIVKIESFIPDNRFKAKDKELLRSYLSHQTRRWGQEALSVKFESPRRPAESLYFVSPEQARRVK